MARLGGDPDPVVVIRTHGTRPMNLTEQLRQLSPTRRALLAAGTVTLAFSMALSIAPAFAAGNGNAGSVKIHDAATGVDDQGNDPQVCTFTIVFFGFDAGASGSWAINSQPAAADDPVLDGTFITAANGEFETSQIVLAAGHYKLDWSLNGGNPKHKSFVVKDSCAPGDSGSGQATPDPSPSDPAASEPAASDPGNSGTPDASPSDPASSEPGQATSDPSPSETASSDPGTTGLGDTGGTTSPTPSASPSGTAGETPEGGVQAITGSGAGTGTLPDTAVDPQPIGITPLLTVLGLLLIVAAHPFIRRSAHADRA